MQGERAWNSVSSRNRRKASVAGDQRKSGKDPGKKGGKIQGRQSLVINEDGSGIYSEVMERH